MTGLSLPPLLTPRTIERACAEASASEGLPAEAIEKDYYLTRLIWAIAQTTGESLLLKGGTLLSKVDLGFRRMSEDVDLVIPWPADRPRTYGSINNDALNRVARVLRDVSPLVGGKLDSFTGARWHGDRGAIWELLYPSPFGPQAITIEVSLQSVITPPRRANLNQLLDERTAPGYADAFAFTLAADEARAEKVRAAFTRRVIRDYYDLNALLDAGADFTSDAFVELVDAKLRESGAEPLHTQKAQFGVTEPELVSLARAVALDLQAVLRAGEPPFDLATTLARFDEIWAARRAQDA